MKESVDPPSTMWVLEIELCQGWQEALLPAQPGPCHTPMSSAAMLDEPSQLQYFLLFPLADSRDDTPNAQVSLK